MAARKTSAGKSTARKSTARKTSTRKKTTTAKKRTSSSRRSSSASDHEYSLENQIGSFIDGISGLTSSALRLAGRTRDSATRAINRSPNQLRMMAAAGDSLKDMRQVLGLTIGEITDALNLKDRNIWEAVEDGREVLSMELILRLASLYARNDPLPFIFKYMRSYQPRLWAVMHELGFEQVPVAIERERSFINIYRRHDAARNISDEGFERVVEFTTTAFDLALSYVADQENVRFTLGTEGDDRQRDDATEADTAGKKKTRVKRRRK